MAIAALGRFTRRGRDWIGVALMLALAGCASQETKRDTIDEINAIFKAEYEAILAENGTRVVNASSDEAFDATIAALVSLGIVIKQQARGLGYLQAEMPAPLPLTRNEWDRTSALDLPKTREVIRSHMGPIAAALFKFDPEGVDIVITATIIEVRGGAEVSLTMRMREVAPSNSDLPRREYPPPTSLRAGLDKIWGALDRQLKAASRMH